MKASQIAALSATLIFQAQACVRVRVDRYTEGNYQTIQQMKLFDNDDVVKTSPFPINFSLADEETRLTLDDYSVTLQYKDGKHHPYGGRVGYPKGREFPVSFPTLFVMGSYFTDGVSIVGDADLQGKTWTTYVDDKGRTHDVYCFSDNYSNCGDYYCGV